MAERNKFAYPPVKKGDVYMIQQDNKDEGVVSRASESASSMFGVAGGALMGAFVHRLAQRDLKVRRPLKGALGERIELLPKTTEQAKERMGQEKQSTWIRWVERSIEAADRMDNPRSRFEAASRVIGEEEEISVRSLFREMETGVDEESSQEEKSLALSYLSTSALKGEQQAKEELERTIDSKYRGILENVGKSLIRLKQRDLLQRAFQEGSDLSEAEEGRINGQRVLPVLEIPPGSPLSAIDFAFKQYNGEGVTQQPKKIVNREQISRGVGVYIGEDGGIYVRLGRENDEIGTINQGVGELMLGEEISDWSEDLKTVLEGESQFPIVNRKIGKWSRRILGEDREPIQPGALEFRSTTRGERVYVPVSDVPTARELLREGSQAARNLFYRMTLGREDLVDEDGRLLTEEEIVQQAKQEAYSQIDQLPRESMVRRRAEKIEASAGVKVVPQTEEPQSEPSSKAQAATFLNSLKTEEGKQAIWKQTLAAFDDDPQKANAYLLKKYQQARSTLEANN